MTKIADFPNNLDCQEADEPVRAVDGDQLYDQDFLNVLKQAEAELADIDSKREELNASKANVMAQLVNFGLNKDAVKAAIKYFRTPEEKRDRFDLSYQLMRKALECPMQDDLFVAAAQKTVDKHKGAKRG